MNNNNNEIRVKVNGGYLVAGLNENMEGNSHDGIYVVFETDDGDIIDIVLAKTETEYNEEEINVYCYENVYNENFTRKFALNNKEIYKALNG